MIALTENAAQKVKELLKGSDFIALRPGVKGGGCSGFSYTLNLSKEADENDRVLQSNGIEIHINKKSYLYLMGTEIDYFNDIQQSGFKFVNPNAKRTCGCGESFSV